MRLVIIGGSGLLLVVMVVCGIGCILGLLVVWFVGLFSLIVLVLGLVLWCLWFSFCGDVIGVG